MWADNLTYHRWDEEKNCWSAAPKINPIRTVAVLLGRKSYDDFEVIPYIADEDNIITFDDPVKTDSLRIWLDPQFEIDSELAAKLWLQATQIIDEENLDIGVSYHKDHGTWITLLDSEEIISNISQKLPKVLAKLDKAKSMG